MNNMIEPFKKDIESLVSTIEDLSEKQDTFPEKFVEAIEYFHSAFAYLLSLVEMNKIRKEATDSSPTPFD